MGQNSVILAVMLEQRGDEVAVELADGLQRDALRAHRGALTNVGAAAESLGVVLGMALTRRIRSGCPCGSMARWVIFAEVNSIEEPFGQAATQAPQPMQVAASKERSERFLLTWTAWASGAAPVFTEM